MSKLFQDWKFKQGHVQAVPEGGDFLSSESCVICAGPPTYSVAQDEATGVNSDASYDDNNLIPIGLVQNATVTQNKQIQQLYEIGSRQPIFIPGRTVVQAALSRILFDGPSLLRALYKINHGDSHTTMPWFDPEADGNVNVSNTPGQPFVKGGDQAKFYINLASEFFNKPIGLAFFLNDMENEEYGGFYLENCYVQSHQISIAGQQTILVENCGLRCSRVIPIDRATSETDIDSDTGTSN